jgi:hypothetical protein
MTASVVIFVSFAGKIILIRRIGAAGGFAGCENIFRRSWNRFAIRKYDKTNS